MTKKWYFAPLKPHKKAYKIKQQVESFLGSDGKIYAPTIKTLSGRQKDVVPGYIYLYLMDEDFNSDWYKLFVLPNLIGHPQICSDEEFKRFISEIETYQSRQEEMYSEYSGQIVRVVRGPFRGFTGEIIETKNGRVKIGIICFGRIVPAEISISDIEPVGA